MKKIILNNFKKIKNKTKKIISYYKKARHEFRSHRSRCRGIGIQKKWIDEIERFQTLFLITKIHWILILGLITIFLYYLSKKFYIGIASYLILGLFGLLFQFFAAIFFGRSLIKNKYMIALESTTRWGVNPDIVKTHIENTFDATIGWFFLMLGFMLQTLAFMLSILI